MKKLIILFIIGLLCSCGGKEENPTADTTSIEDSLNNIISQKDAELNDILGTFNSIQEGFHEINLAQGRVNLNGVQSEKMSKEDIMENISFIKSTMQQNRERIARLQQQVKNGAIKAENLNAVIESLTREMQEKQKQIDELTAQLQQKDIIIESQGKEITQLNSHVEKLSASNDAKAKVVSKQDKQLNTAWYVFGTKKELKAQGIMKSNDVLKTSDYNIDYFTKVDIRNVKTIKLYSKSAKLLTTHPAGSYTLTIDAQKQYTLNIKDANAFWSVSRYLVVLVK